MIQVIHRQQYSAAARTVLAASLLVACGSRPERPAITERTWSHKLYEIPHGISGRPIAIRNVTVIDVNGGPPKPAQDLLIEDGRLAAIQPAGTVEIPDPAEVIDATGLFVMPGLWDMHVHLSAWGDAGRDLGFRLLLANGVTAVRDLGGFPGFLPRWRQEIELGAVAPRLWYSGQALSFPGAPFETHVPVGGEPEARRIVRRMKSIGADFIKVHSGVPALAYPAVISEARSLGLPVVGHVPRALTAAVVAEAGQKSIEHMFGIAGRFEDFFNPSSLVSPGEIVTPEMRQLFETLKANNTWVTPTTAVLLKVLQAPG